MIRGISLEATQSQHCLLKEILSPICIKDYYWFRPIEQEEVWSRPDGKPFFLKDIYTGSELEKLIQNDHFVVFLRLEAYIDERSITRGISTYYEYCKSQCRVVLLITDCESVELYIKDKDVLQKAYKALKLKFVDVRYITDENDTRTGMNIL